MKHLSKSALAAGVVLLAVGGCGKTPFESLLELPQTRKEVDPVSKVETTYYAPGELPQVVELGMVEACRERKMEREREQEAADRAEQSAILEAAADSDNPEVLMSYFLSRTTERVTESITKMNVSIWGREQEDECSSGTNMWDFMSAESAERQKTYRVAWTEGGNLVNGVVKWAVGGWVLTTGFNNSGDDVGGDKVEAGRDAQYAKRDATMENTHRTAETHQTGVNDSTQNADQAIDGAASGEGQAELDASGNPCKDPTPILYNGTCYSQDSVDERGFPVGE